MVLSTAGGFVDQEGVAHGCSGGVVNPRKGGPAGSVLSAGVAPDDHEPVVGQRSNPRFVLVACRDGVDLELRAKGACSGVKLASEHAVTGTVVTAGVLPDYHQVPIGISGHIRQFLRAGQRGVDQHFAADSRAGVVEALQHDVVPTATGVRVGGPHCGKTGRHAAAAFISCHHAVVLVAAGRGIEQNRAAIGTTGCVIKLAVDAVTRDLGGVVLPGDDETAVGQARHMGVILNAAGSGVDLELRAHRHAAGAISLGIDAVVAAVLAVGGPDDHVAIQQLGDLWIVLCAHRVGVDLLLTIGQGCTVELLRDVDGQYIGRAGAAVTVGDAQAQGTTGIGAGLGVAVAQALHHLLHHFGGDQSAVVEVDAQVGAVDTAVDRADGGAAITDGIAGHADLARQISLMDHPQLVLGGSTGEEVEVQPAAIEVGRVGVGQAHCRVDDLQAGVDQVLVKGDGADEVDQLRVGLSRHFGCGAEDLLGDLVGGVATVIDGYVVGIRHHIVAVAQVRNGGQVLLVAGRVGYHRQLALPVDGDAARGEFADVDVVVAACAAAVVVIVVPRDHETAGRKASHSGLVLPAVGSFVDQKLGADLRSGAVVALAINSRAGTILVVRTPHHDKAVVRQCCDAGFVLRTGSEGIDQEHIGEGAQASVVGASVNAMT